tara:strand:+ start:269 stop:868 length:600 start_codon:yes stop_codon:yes gene_type:complete
MTDSIFEMTVLNSQCPILSIKIPELILKEIDEWVDDSRDIKNHPLSYLKAHENYGFMDNPQGKKYNSFQSSISYSLIQKSYWFAWVIRLCEKYFGKEGKTHRYYRMRQCYGHFHGYDIWTNFSYKGDKNPTHNHQGYVSGIIYYKNHGHPTVFDDFGGSYDGIDGTMLLFPSDTAHHVDEQIVDEERITIAFNLMESTD